MNVRSSIVATVKEIEAAIRELQDRGVIAVSDVVVTVSNSERAELNSPLASSVIVTIPGRKSS
jgi:vacuolar-type H+-ATPase subunit F/Vma7